VQAFAASVEADSAQKARFDGLDILSTFASESSDSVSANASAGSLKGAFAAVKVDPNRPKSGYNHAESKDIITAIT
jgi:hypothetical protein